MYIYDTLIGTPGVVVPLVADSRLARLELERIICLCGAGLASLLLAGWGTRATCIKVKEWRLHDMLHILWHTSLHACCSMDIAGLSNFVRSLSVLHLLAAGGVRQKIGIK